MYKLFWWRFERKEKLAEDDKCPMKIAFPLFKIRQTIDKNKNINEIMVTFGQNGNQAQI